MAPYKFNPFIGNFDYYETGSGDISGGLSNLLLVDGTSNFTLVSDSVNDVLLLVA